MKKGHEEVISLCKTTFNIPERFTITCNKCGSTNVEITITYYSKTFIQCQECREEEE